MNERSAAVVVTHHNTDAEKFHKTTNSTHAHTQVTHEGQQAVVSLSHTPSHSHYSVLLVLFATITVSRITPHC